MERVTKLVCWGARLWWGISGFYQAIAPDASQYHQPDVAHPLLGLEHALCKLAPFCPATPEAHEHHLSRLLLKRLAHVARIYPAEGVEIIVAGVSDFMTHLSYSVGKPRQLKKLRCLSLAGPKCGPFQEVDKGSWMDCSHSSLPMF